MVQKSEGLLVTKASFTGFVSVLLAELLHAVSERNASNTIFNLIRYLRVSEVQAGVPADESVVARSNTWFRQSQISDHRIYVKNPTICQPMAERAFRQSHPPVPQ